MSDDKVKRIPLEELEVYAERLAERGDARSANEALLLSQLVASLRANAERDLLLASMARRFDELERSFMNESEVQSNAYRELVAEFRIMQRRQKDLNAKQEMQARLIDVGISKISEVAARIKILTESTKDLTEP